MIDISTGKHFNAPRCEYLPTSAAKEVAGHITTRREAIKTGLAAIIATGCTPYLTGSANATVGGSARGMMRCVGGRMASNFGSNIRGIEYEEISFLENTRSTYIRLPFFVRNSILIHTVYTMYYYTGQCTIFGYQSGDYQDPRLCLNWQGDKDCIGKGVSIYRPSPIYNVAHDFSFYANNIDKTCYTIQDNIKYEGTINGTIENVDYYPLLFSYSCGFYRSNYDFLRGNIKFFDVDTNGLRMRLRPVVHNGIGKMLDLCSGSLYEPIDGIFGVGNMTRKIYCPESGYGNDIPVEYRYGNT